MLNNIQQKYDILGRFFISGKEYVRVKFITTKHEQVVPASQVATGDFEDASIVSKPSAVKPVRLSEPVVSKEEIKASIEALKEVTAQTTIAPVPPVPMITAEFKPLGLEIDNKASLVDTDEFKLTVIATNPKGKEVIVAMDELQAFCETNKLDYDVVVQVIEGHQKTHRKWRFRKGE